MYRSHQLDADKAKVKPKDINRNIERAASRRSAIRNLRGDRIMAYLAECPSCGVDFSVEPSYKVPYFEINSCSKCKARLFYYFIDRICMALWNEEMFMKSFAEMYKEHREK